MTKTIDLSTFTSIKIGPKVDILVLNEKIALPSEHFLIGHGSNIIISPTPPKLAILSKDFDYIKQKNNTICVGGATIGGKFLSYAKKNNFGGFEFLQKIPGSVGGMVKMNAGLKEWEIFNNLLGIKTENGFIPKDEINFGYRYAKFDGIVYEAIFEIKNGFNKELLIFFENLRKNQPTEPSAGSCFKNPKGFFAGKLLEEAGLKGLRIGNMGFSAKHANFLINLGGGTYEEAKELVELAKATVLKKFNVKLEEEIIFVDNHSYL